MDKSTPPPEEKGKAKEETVNSSQPGQDPKMSLEMLNAIWEAAREKAARNFYNGVPASVAIPALLAMEEEGLRESLFEDDLDEEERARILSHLE
ncbi:hypothetical protein N0V88_002127 [Collariella sp. IMI 366227]|nr:hypothetical protein N0V88_002127 [Collariella sp. IMI 366227]